MEELKKIGPDRIRELHGIFGDAEQVWENDIYVVGLWRSEKKFDGRNMIRLSIKRHDKQPISSWTDKQDIKNHVVGKEYAAVELYPADADLVDQSNQYHLWVVDEPGYRFPFAWRGRATRVDDVEKGEICED